MISENKEDNIRQFIISFFCGDDTIQVFEYAERNSGLWSGKFLEKQRHKSPITGKYYVEKDFQVGETVSLAKYKFQLLKCDEFTYKYMKERPHIFKEANIEAVVDRIRSCKCLVAKDSLNCIKLTLEDMINNHLSSFDYIVAKKYPSNEEFAIDLFRKLDKNQNDYIDFDELYEGIKS